MSCLFIPYSIRRNVDHITKIGPNHLGGFAGRAHLGRAGRRTPRAIPHSGVDRALLPPLPAAAAYPAAAMSHSADYACLCRPVHSSHHPALRQSRIAEPAAAALHVGAATCCWLPIFLSSLPTCVSGLSTLTVLSLSHLLVHFQSTLDYSLMFVGGVMTTVSIRELLPEALSQVRLLLPLHWPSCCFCRACACCASCASCAS